jgi:hypothetical protein
MLLASLILNYVILSLWRRQSSVSLWGITLYKYIINNAMEGYRSDNIFESFCFSGKDCMTLVLQ